LVPADALGVSTLAIARQAGVLYGAALAAGQLRDFAKARVYLARLRALPDLAAPAARLSRMLDAEIALAAGDLAHAAAAMRPVAAASMGAGEGAVSARPELFLQAQIALQNNQSGAGGVAAAVAESAQHLQLWVATHPNDALAWQWLSSSNAALGQRLRAIRADAESRVAQLDYAAALDRLKAAQELVRQQRGGNTADAPAEHIDASIIDTRQREVQALAKEQTLDR
jgi:predicted Zn-dependent protease